MIGIDEALRRVLAAVRPVGDEEVGLLDALGRTLAEEVVAREDVPPFANSAMDGFAVRGEDLSAGVRDFVLVDEVPAGYVSQVRLAPGQAARIMTGAPLPDGADTVVQVELTEAAGARRCSRRDRASDRRRSGCWRRSASSACAWRGGRA